MEFEMDLEYRRGEWKASCVWSGKGGMYGYDNLLNISATGEKPETAIENLVKAVYGFLETTANKIREDFAKMVI